MANQLGPRQWSLDTPASFGPPNSIIWNANLNINHIQWDGYTAATDVCVLKDQNGFIIEQLSGTTDKQEVRSGKIGWVNGLVLDQLTSGKVIVYLAP